jgi:hypothetical protein
MSTEASTLYVAATESLVSESSATSTFEKMIAVAFTHSSGETFSKELRETEKQIKKDFEISSMPGPWRSAKSVIQTALKMGIGLVDDNGGFYGKTHLQNTIKALKTDVKEPLTNEAYATKVCSLLSSIPEELDAKKVYKLVITFLEGVV